MRRAILLAAIIGAALLFPATAAAKGPSQASISGPGLDHALTFAGYGEGGEGDTSSPLGILVMEGGFFPQAFDQSPSPLLRAPPRGTLGPRYNVIYVVPGPSTNGDQLQQDLYPYATGGPASYMKPHQRFWDSQSTRGGWYRGTIQLKQMLVHEGLPANAPASRSTRAHRVGIALGAGAGAALAVAALTMLYRRFRSASS